MAASYELGVLTVAPLTLAPYATIRTGATRRARIWEISAFATAATASPMGLGVPANIPVATTSELGQALTVNDPAATVNVDTAWSTAPTAPAHFFRRYGIPATIGSGFIWVFQRPLIIGVSSWLVLWNYGAATAGICSLNVSWDEE